MGANIITGNNSEMWITIGVIVLVAAAISLATLMIIRNRRL